MKQWEALLVVLDAESNKVLHYIDITNRIINAGLHRFTAREPWRSVLTELTSNRSHRKLFKRVGSGNSGKYTIGDTGEAEKHLRIIKAKRPDLQTVLELEQVRADREEEGAFNPSDTEDARKRILADIAIRQGRSEFRAKLLAAYHCTCSVTGCDVEEALEAAHIVPYLGPKTDRVCNGLLLRGDVHTLFDRNLIAISPANHQVLVSKHIRGKFYNSFAGKKINLPVEPKDRPSREALEKHLKDFKENEDGRADRPRESGV